MSHEKHTAPENVGNRWGDAISEERQRELDARLQAWEHRGNTDSDEQRSAFSQGGNGGWSGGRLSGADVFYLAVRSLAAELGDPDVAATWLRGGYSQPRVRPQRFLSTLHLEGTDLSGAQLERAILLEGHLESANLSGANLQEAVLDGAHLENACLAHADLRWADFVAAFLMGVDLSRAHMEDANLTNAHLEGAILIGTYLDNAILDDAHLEHAQLSGVDLSRVTAPRRKRRTGWRLFRKRAGS